MASTPSASALSAVLRCRGNFWARNPPTKRPATSAYSLGLAGSVVRDSPAERSRANQASPWESFLQGERVAVGRRLTVAFESPRVDGKVQRGKDSKDMNKLYHPKLSQSSGDARSAVPGLQNALMRQLTRTLTSNLPGIDKCSKITQKIKYETNAAHVCKIVFVRGTRGFPAGVVRVSITSPCLLEKKGQTPALVFTGWSSLKSTCLSLTALMSQLVLMKLLYGSSSIPDDAPQLLLSQEEENSGTEVLQANVRTPCPTDIAPAQNNPSSGQMISEDRPD
ncbi:uncharacterized protein LOC121513827 [Cheilinus undulatus]|uniref:uncharacterized protein LOC121513827 n=1 Tax=Cheilinus undulatus TaxID=241271 RepID=UPI001BD40273|nr:uncharacterized protein LOC121513827 [Cheilinus undulatus]